MMVLIEHPQTGKILNLSLAETFTPDGNDMILHFPGTRIIRVEDLTASALFKYNSTQSHAILYRFSGVNCTV